MNKQIVLALMSLVAAVTVHAEPSMHSEHYELRSAEGLRLHNVIAEPATLDKKNGLRLTGKSQPTEPSSEQLAILTTPGFSNGIIEAEVAGIPAPDAGEDARGFVGIAFRVQKDLRTYDAFYLRPTNGRADDQERRNHSAQYISHPEWTWSRLREESPSKYESYVDLVPGAWTKLRIEVNGSSARLFVHDQEQPTLIVNDLKSGNSAVGGIALWIGPGTIAHFRGLKVTSR